MPLNYANIIALPLLLGIGVAFDIYFVMNWRRGVTEHLQSSTARAVLFSACTTLSRLRQPRPVERPRHRRHGQTAIDLARLHAAVHAGCPARTAGTGAAQARGATSP